MKIPLHYQVSEFDCGPTTVLNAMSYLFQREDLPAEIVRNIMIYCLDCYKAQNKSQIYPNGHHWKLQLLSE